MPRETGAAGRVPSLLYSARNSAGVGFLTEPTLYMVLLLWLLNQFALAGVMNVADNSNNEPTACNVFMVYSWVCTAPMKRLDCSRSERELWLQIGNSAGWTSW